MNWKDFEEVEVVEVVEEEKKDLYTLHRFNKDKCAIFEMFASVDSVLK